MSKGNRFEEDNEDLVIDNQKCESAVALSVGPRWVRVHGTRPVQQLECAWRKGQNYHSTHQLKELRACSCSIKRKPRGRRQLLQCKCSTTKITQINSAKIVALESRGEFWRSFLLSFPPAMSSGESLNSNKKSDLRVYFLGSCTSSGISVEEELAAPDVLNFIVIDEYCWHCVEISAEIHILLMMRKFIVIFGFIAELFNNKADFLASHCLVFQQGRVFC